MDTVIVADKQLTALVVRPGAIGDVLESMSICAALKRKGFRVTFMAEEPNVQVAVGNPNVDDFLVCTKAGKSPEQLGTEWFELGKRYDVFMPLSQIVEGLLIAGDNSTHYYVSPAARHKLCNHNFVEFLHLACGLPYVPTIRFYPTAEELDWARTLRARIKERFVLINVTHGSSVHKIWPHQATFIHKALARYPDLHVLMTGGEVGQVWADEFRRHQRVTSLVNKTSLRQYLTLPFVCDALLGPETGIFYAAAFMDIPKILLLSHGTTENVSRDWINCTSIYSESLKWCKGRGHNEAPACHQIHLGWDHCTRVRDESCKACVAGNCHKHLAACQQAISAERVMESFDRIIAPQMSIFSPPPRFVPLPLETMA